MSPTIILRVPETAFEEIPKRLKLSLGASPNATSGAFGSSSAGRAFCDLTGVICRF
jgi:hypothetical protein